MTTGLCDHDKTGMAPGAACMLCYQESVDAVGIVGLDSPADKRLAIVSDERDAARFDAHCLRQEKEQLRLENERLRAALRGLVNAVSLDLPRGLDDAYAVAVQALQPQG